MILSKLNLDCVTLPKVLHWLPEVLPGSCQALHEHPLTAPSPAPPNTSHCSPSPTSVPSLFFGLDHRPSLCLECSPCRSLHSRPPQPFLSVSYSGKLQPPASRSSHLLAFLDFFPEHLPPSSVLAYLVYCSSSLSIQPPIRT